MINEKIVRSSRSDNHCSITEVLGCEDLLNSILILLPARTLIRFKLVSKQWLSIISDPGFCTKHSHLNHHSDSTGIYFYNAFSKSPEIISVSISTNPVLTSIPSLSFLEDKANLLRRRFRIVQSCNGLLLCCFHTFEFSPNSTSTSSRLYCVCNPATRSLTMLPEFPKAPLNNLVLAFNPLESSAYKVVGIRVGRKLEFFIYLADQDQAVEKNVRGKSRTKVKRSWRKVENPIEKKRICHGVFHSDDQMNPMITWICEDSVIHFDVVLEKVVKVLDNVFAPRDVYATAYVGASKDNGFPYFLFVTQNSSISGGGFLIVSRLGINLSPFAWGDPTLRVYIGDLLMSSHPEIEQLLHYFQYNLQVLSVEDEDDDDDDQLFLAIPGKVICCSKSSVRVICELPRNQIHYPKQSGFEYSSMGYSFKYLETLALV